MSNHLKTLIFGLALGLATPGMAQQTAANYLVQPIGVEFAESPASTSFVFRVQQYLENISSETIKVDMSLVRKHPLGDKVAVRFHLLDKNYLYMSVAAPGSFSGKVYVHKPLIYNSLQKIDKDLRNKVKKGVATPEEGAEQLCHYLDCALALMDENTGFFEEALRKAGSSGELIHLFDSITITR